MRIHVTERQVFKQCRRRHYYEYRLHLHPKVEKKGPLWVGRAGHAGLAAYYQGQDALLGLDEWLQAKLTGEESGEELREIDEAVALVRSILERYPEFAQENDDFQVVGVEMPLEYPIPRTRVTLVGTLDLLVRKQGRLWVVDHKFLQSFADPEVLELDDQMSAYLYLVWKTFDEVPGGAIYNQLRKKVPAIPFRLKAGGLSKNRSIDTTKEIYLGEILRLGLDPADYADILAALEANEFFRREPIARNWRELDNFGRYLEMEAREMFSKTTPIYPAPSRDCLWSCPYRFLCKIENEGGDFDGAREALFYEQEGRIL